MDNNKAKCTATGGGILKLLTLSPLEEAEANLLQFHKQINLGGVVQRVQCQSQSQECELVNMVFETADSFVLANMVDNWQSVQRENILLNRDTDLLHTGNSVA